MGVNQETYERLTEPIIFFGDFNEILGHHEKERGGTRDEKDTDAFRGCLDNCSLRDLGYRGSTFTWSRGNSPATMIRERLDRFVACSWWQQIFHSYDIRHFSIYRLDHAPLCSICLDHEGKGVTQNYLGSSLFGSLMMIVEKWILMLGRKV